MPGFLSQIIQNLRFLDLQGPQFKVTREGGWAFQLINKTGAPSVKGQGVNFSPDVDDAYVAATSPYTVIGVVYEAGKPDGDRVWVVRDGIADMLLEDGYQAARNQWVRLSPTTPGRFICQDLPGLDFYPASVTYDSGNGSTVSGSITSVREDDGTKLEIGGTTGIPSIDARFTWTGLTEQPDELILNGYFAANRTGGVDVYIWDFVAGGGSWVLAGNFPAAAIADTTITFDAITADMLSAGEMRVRLLGNTAGTTSDRLWIDKLILRSTSDTEHFKECGHTMRAAAAGTNVLARANIHFL